MFATTFVQDHSHPMARHVIPATPKLALAKTLLAERTRRRAAPKLNVPPLVRCVTPVMQKAASVGSLYSITQVMRGCFAGITIPAIA